MGCLQLSSRAYRILKGYNLPHFLNNRANNGKGRSARTIISGRHQNTRTSSTRMGGRDGPAHQARQDLLARDGRGTPAPDGRGLGDRELIQLTRKCACVHRTAVNDVARVEHLTFICTTRKKPVRPTTGWRRPASQTGEDLDGSRGRVMSSPILGRPLVESGLNSPTASMWSR